MTDSAVRCSVGHGMEDNETTVGAKQRVMSEHRRGCHVCHFCDVSTTRSFSAQAGRTGWVSRVMTQPKYGLTSSR